MMGFQHKGQNKMVQDKQCDDSDKGLKNKPPLPPQHKQKIDTELPVKENQLRPTLSGHTGVASHLETTTLSAVMIEQQSSLPSIIMPDSDVSGTNAEGIRHSTPIERMAIMKEGISLKRLSSHSNTLDVKDRSGQSTSVKNVSKKDKPRRERRQSGVVSTRVPHRSGSGGNTSLHSISKHGRVKSAPNTSVEKLKKRLSKKESTKLLKQRKGDAIPGQTDKIKTPLKFGKSRHKSEKVKHKHSSEDHSKKLAVSSVNSDKGVDAYESVKKSKDISSCKTKASGDSRLIKKKHKRHKERTNIMMSDGIVSYPSHNTQASAISASGSESRSLALAVTSTVGNPAATSLSSCTNLTTASASSSIASSERPASTFLEIPGYHKKRPSSSLSEETPMSIASSKKLRNLAEQPPLHNKSKLDKMISVVACLSAQKSPTSKRRQRHSLPESGATGSEKKRLWMAGTRSSPEDIFGESLGSASVGTSLYDSSRISFGGFYTGPRKRSNSDSLSECSRMESGPQNNQKRKRRKSNSLLELSTFGVNFNMDISRPSSAMGMRKDDVSDIITSAGHLKLPLGQDGGQFTQDMLELCKNIKESSWIQNTAVKSLDTSVVLTFDPPLSDQLKQSTQNNNNQDCNEEETNQAGGKNYIPPEGPDVNEEAPRVLDIISKINKIAKDPNNNQNPLELCVPKSYFSPAGVKRNDMSKETKDCTDNRQSTSAAEPTQLATNPDHSYDAASLIDSSLEEADGKRTRPSTRASASATFIVHSSPDVSTQEVPQHVPVTDPNDSSERSLHIITDENINIQLSNEKVDMIEECFGKDGEHSHSLGPTPSEDERTVDAIMSKYIPEREVKDRRHREIRRESRRGSDRKDHNMGPPFNVGGSGDELAFIHPNLTMAKQIWNNKGSEPTFPSKNVRKTYDPSTQAAVLSNREERTPQIGPDQPVDLRIIKSQRDKIETASCMRGDLLEEASLCLQQANKMQNTAFSHLVEHLNQQQGLIEQLQTELLTQKEERLSSEVILRNLTESLSVKKS